MERLVDRSSGHVLVQLVIFRLVLLLIALFSDSTWALAAAPARSGFARTPADWRTSAARAARPRSGRVLA